PNNVTTTTAPMSITSFRPDLTLTAVSATAAAAGRPLSVTTTTRNAGTAPADRAFTVAFYLSADDTLDAGDVALGGRTSFTGTAAGPSRRRRRRAGGHPHHRDALHARHPLARSGRG